MKPHKHRDEQSAARRWLVRVGVQDYDGEWWDRKYEVTAADRHRALEAGAVKAREANRYALAVQPYGATTRPR